MLLHAFGPPPEDGDPSAGVARAIFILFAALSATLILRLAGA